MVDIAMARILVVSDLGVSRAVAAPTPILIRVVILIITGSMQRIAKTIIWTVMMHELKM